MSFRQEGFEPRKKRATGDSSLERELNNGQRGSLKSVLNNGQREILDHIIARMFYTAGLPFNLARNPYYAKAFTYAATHNISGYVPPGYNKLRTTLLDKERVHIENLVEPIKYKWGEKGVTIVSDGWIDVERRPLINFMAVADSAPMFLKAVNCEGVVKDKYKIASLIRETIKEVGPTHVVQVLTDNAPVCKAAGKIIEQEYPNIFWTPCVVHTLNLALKNICAAKNTDANEVVYGECSWITEVVSDCTYIRNFILNHSMRNHMFTQHSKLKMLSIADTRFASAIIMLRRFKAIRQGLSNMVMDQAWSDYKEDDVRKAQVVKQKIVSDIWWDKIDYILSFTEPIYEMLRACDTDEPTLHLVYEMWDTMIAKVKVAIYHHEHLDEDDSSSFFNVVSKILNDRWSKSTTPLHCLAYSLNPRYYCQEWLQRCQGRLPPHRDVEISKQRDVCLRKYFPDYEVRKVVISEFGDFAGCTGEFSSVDSQLARGHMDPKKWWVMYGACAPELQKLALRVLGHPSSSSCCERNWSTYSFIHSIDRHQMDPKRAEDLVFVHSNLRLLSRKTLEYKAGETMMWDVAGDAFDNLTDTGIMEIANLSLDEPELEQILFVDEIVGTSA